MTCQHDSSLKKTNKTIICEFLIDTVLPGKCTDCVTNVAGDKFKCHIFIKIFFYFVHLSHFYGLEMQVKVVSNLYLL